MQSLPNTPILPMTHYV